MRSKQSTHVTAEKALFTNTGAGGLLRTLGWTLRHKLADSPVIKMSNQSQRPPRERFGERLEGRSPAPGGPPSQHSLSDLTFPRRGHVPERRRRSSGGQAPSRAVPATCPGARPRVRLAPPGTGR